MLNFETPRRSVLYRAGPATKLVSQDRTLDYSGRPLNLAARLMDFARPSGVVLDGQFRRGSHRRVRLGGFFSRQDLHQGNRGASTAPAGLAQLGMDDDSRRGRADQSGSSNGYLRKKKFH